MFNAGVQHEGPYVLVVATGRAELPELCALAEFSAKIQNEGCERALIRLPCGPQARSGRGAVPDGDRAARSVLGFGPVRMMLLLRPRAGVSIFASKDCS